jgi:hypothetical protein
MRERVMGTVTFEVPPTAGEIFGATVEHLARQKKQSAVIADGTRSCRYRMDDGRRCAVSIFIPDYAYSQKECEGRDVYGLIAHCWKLPEWMSEPAMVSLLDALQQAHDYVYGIDDLKEELRNIASDRMLDPSCIELITEFAVIGKTYDKTEPK